MVGAVSVAGLLWNPFLRNRGRLIEEEEESKDEMREPVECVSFWAKKSLGNCSK